MKSELRQLESALTVEDLICELEAMPKDARVLFACDYGDITHTQQALPVESINERGGTSLVDSAYSRSGVAFVEADDLDEKGYYCPACDEEWTITICPKCKGRCVDEAGNPVDDDDESATVVILN